MTTSRDARLFTKILAAIAALALAGCQSSRLEDLAPLSGVRNTGTTPDLNVPQTAETEQFSDADRTAKIAELRAAQSNQSIGAAAPPAPASAAQLRRAAKAQADTLKEIEGE